MGEVRGTNARGRKWRQWREGRVGVVEGGVLPY
jgi:hypothetical protein